MGIEVGGFFGFVFLILEVWAIISIVQSCASTGSKVLWVVFILILPLFGLIVWFLAGPKAR